MKSMGPTLHCSDPHGPFGYLNDATDNGHVAPVECADDPDLGLEVPWPELARLRASLSSDPHAIETDRWREARFARGLRRVLSALPGRAVLQQVAALTEGSLRAPRPALPDPGEVQRHLLPWVEPLRARLPHVTTDLNVSTSTAFGDRVCLGLVIRLHDVAGRSQIKIRIAAFADPQGRVHWEVGFVDNARSLQRLRRNFVETRQVPHDPAMLRGLVDATCALAALRPAVVALDLTPAHFHVLPLCLAMGGRPVVEFDLRQWMARLQHAAMLSLERLQQDGTPLPHGLTWDQLRAIKRRYVVAWLFARGWMLDPASGQPCSWTPPRLLRFF